MIVNWVFDDKELLNCGDPLTVNVLLSLFTDRRALDADVLPAGLGSDRRGWWGDSFSDKKIGSRLWLLSREKQLTSVLKRAKEYTEEALQWLVTGDYVQSVVVSAVSLEPEIMQLQIVITQKLNAKPVELSFRAILREM